MRLPRAELSEVLAGSMWTYFKRAVNAALFAVARRWKQPNCPWTGEWINKMWSAYLYTLCIHCIYTCSGMLFCLKRKGILTEAPMWMNLEGVILREISQT